MQGGQDQLAGLIGFEDAEIGNNGGRAAAAQSGFFALGAPREETSRGHEIHFFGETPFLVRGHDVAAIGPGGDLLRAAGAGQAHFGVYVVTADDGGVDVAEAVNLRAAQEAHVHVAALEVQGEDIVHADHRKRPADQRRVADGERQARRFRPDDTRFVDHDQVGGVRPLGQVAGQVGLSDADENDIAIPQQAGGVDDHQFGRGVGERGHGDSGEGKSDE